MKKDPKPLHVIAAERREAEELAADILKLTERIPQHVMNAPGVMAARRFKESMSKARTVASAKTLNLAKLRLAMNEVKFYYRPTDQ
jgi:hypothetical protein